MENEFKLNFENHFAVNLILKNLYFSGRHEFFSINIPLMNSLEIDSMIIGSPCSLIDTLFNFIVEK